MHWNFHLWARDRHLPIANALWDPDGPPTGQTDIEDWIWFDRDTEKFVLFGVGAMSEHVLRGYWMSYVDAGFPKYDSSSWELSAELWALGAKLSNVFVRHDVVINETGMTGTVAGFNLYDGGTIAAIREIIARAPTTGLHEWVSSLSPRFREWLDSIQGCSLRPRSTGWESPWNDGRLREAYHATNADTVSIRYEPPGTLVAAWEEHLSRWLTQEVDGPSDSTQPDCPIPMVTRTGRRVVPQPAPPRGALRRSSSYDECYYCGNEAYTTTDEYFEESGVPICEDCIPDQRIIKAWDYKPREFTKIGQVAPWLGVELEVEVPSSRQPHEIALIAYKYGHYVVHDGTINHGFEICSQPTTLDRHNWAPLLSLLKTAGCFTADNTGLHIHVSRAGLSHVQQLKLAHFVYSQPRRMALLGGRDISACSRHAKFKVPTRIANSATNDTKYEAVNFMHGPSIELRFFKATLDNFELTARLQFAHALYRFVKQVSACRLVDPQEAWKAFVAFVEKDRKMYNQLSKTLKEARYE